jgi:hypothetical protein
MKAARFRTIAILVVLAVSTVSEAAARPLFQLGAPAEVKQDEISQIIKLAEVQYQKGEQAYSAGEYFQARQAFDKAVDEILLASIDVRSDDRLKIYYRQLIEKINRYQIASLEQKDGGFSEQRFEPSPLDKIASLSDEDLDEEGEADVNGGSVNFAFSITTPVK